jgi:hypothetical protein
VHFIYSNKKIHRFCSFVDSVVVMVVVVVFVLDIFVEAAAAGVNDDDGCVEV